MIGGIPWYYIIIMFLGSGILVTSIKFLWQFSKRDAKLDEALKEIKYAKDKIAKLEEKWDHKTNKVDSKIGASVDRVNLIEKTLGIMEVNQKNLIHSIDTQNKQILDLVDRLEKNHNVFIKSQSLVNTKLGDSIDAIKDSLINQGNTHCIFHKKALKEIKEIVGL